MRVNRLRTRASVALLILCGLPGCASVPDSRVVPEGFAPPGTPVDVRLLWDGSGPTIYYDQTKGSWVSESFGAGIVGVLLLPVALIRDAAAGSANRIRERQARWIADSLTRLPDRDSVETRLAETLRARLGWVALTLADCEDCNAPPDALVLTIAPVIAMSLDARALLFEFYLSVCSAEGTFKGKFCADDRPLEARVLVRSDSFPGPSKNDASRARLVAIINDLYDAEGLADKERAQQAQAHEKALDRVRDQQLYADEATMLAIDDWVSDGGERLKEAFDSTVHELAQAVQAMRDHPGPPARNKMSVSRVIFPMYYDRELQVKDLDEIQVEPDGRRLLRSRNEPMREGGSVDDSAANVWFSVPSSQDGVEAPEQALIDFMYR